MLFAAAKKSKDREYVAVYRCFSCYDILFENL